MSSYILENYLSDINTGTRWFLSFSLDCFKWKLNGNFPRIPLWNTMNKDIEIVPGHMQFSVEFEFEFLFADEINYFCHTEKYKQIFKW